MLKVNDIVSNGIETGIVKKLNNNSYYSYTILWNNGCTGNYSKEYLIIKGFIK